MYKTKVSEKNCEKCGHTKKTVTHSCTCDMCSTAVEKPVHPLEMTIYKEERNNEELQFCSWCCLLEYAYQVEVKGFIDLGILEFSRTTEGMTVADFWQAVSDFDLQSM